MNKYELSIVIPCYNRYKILDLCLEALKKQEGLKRRFEVIAIDDASDIPIKPLNRKYKNNKIFDLKVVELKERKGASHARNIGIKKSLGKYILFIGDDIIGTPSLIAEHIKAHEQFPKENIAIQGYVTWSNKININDFQYWLEHGGPQSCYDELIDGKEVDFKKFYTTNSSFKREYLLKNGIFNSKIRIYYEDLEFAYRLKKRGLKIIYIKKAQGYHYHQVNIKSYRKRMVEMGKNAYLLLKIHPELFNIFDDTLNNGKSRLRNIIDPTLFLLFGWLNTKKINYRYYSTVLSTAFIKGYKETENAYD